MTSTERTVIVTGASRGLGRAIALRFGGLGDHVVIGYRSRADEAEATLSAVRAAGGDGETLGVDVRDHDAVADAVAKIVAARGAVDVLVNNAGIVRDEPFALMSNEAWTDVLRTNLDGAFHFARAAARSMIAHKSGVIVNVGSIAGHRASRGQANYAAAKAGLTGLTATLAAELAGHGVRVNGVLPGFVRAGMAERLDHRVAARAREQIPLKRFAEANEIAEVVAFLASPASSYIVGQSIVVDGGLSL